MLKFNFKKSRKVIMLFAVFLVIGGVVIFYHFQTVRSAVYGWVQTDWSSGAEIGWT